MNNAPVLFLVGALTLAALATLVVWIASRPRKVRFGQSIETFNRDLNALAPPGTRHHIRARATHSGPPGPKKPDGMTPTANRMQRPGPSPTPAPDQTTSGASASDTGR